ncbi:MAG: OmpH family outer membrane protein [Bacteroidetes bacterium]|nr:MAG: OmpH family outer membrane protein [Bacteroidota bacterium]
MKNKFYWLIISVAMVAVSCSSKEKESSDASTTKKDTTARVPVVKGGMKLAFYHLDSLKLHYKKYVEVEADVRKKQERFQSELARKQKSLEDYVVTNEQRMKSGQLSDNEIMHVQQEAQSRQATLLEYQQTEGVRLEESTFKAFDVLNKRVQAAGKEYCEENQIDVLLINGEGGQINFMSPSMDVTNEFIEFLNQYQEKIDKDLKGKK